MNDHHPSTFALDFAHASDMGMRRMNNQDAVAVMVTNDTAAWATRGHLFMVADGMGAHAAGELASKLAVDNIPHTYFKLRDLYPPAALRQAIRDANRIIHTKGQSSVGFQGMGTTCSCLVLLPQGALVAHIGDSRVYRLRGKTLEQLTFDHSLVWEMAAAGQIPEAEVPPYIPKNVITRSLGPHPTVNIDIEGPYSAEPGDVFLLCSDGLSGQISDEEIGAVLQCLPPDEAVQSLVDVANLRGGPDNISVVIARVVRGESTADDMPSIAPPNKGEAPRAWRWPGWPFTLAFVAGLLLLAYCVAGKFWFAATTVAVFELVLVGAWSYRIGAASKGLGDSIGGPYGNGPYRTIDCAATKEVANAFAEIAGRLRLLPDNTSAQWNVDWSFFDDLREKAASAVSEGRWLEAIRDYCRAVRHVMRQFRDRRPPLGDPAEPGTGSLAS